MWANRRPLAVALAVFATSLAWAGAARADDAEGFEEPSAEPQDDYYGRRHDPLCREGSASPEYRLKMAALRVPDESLPEPRWVGDCRELRLRAVHGDESVTVVPFDDSGEPAAEAAARIADVFLGRREGDEARVDPRLVRILYVIALHFRAREIVVVSGIRRPEEDGRTSNHHHGRAADIVVPGVPNEEVAAYAREFGRVGVGLYPVSGFVHVDVRERSFFWRDVSGPGEPICTQAILPEVAREVDELYDPAFEDPRTWAPVPMPPEPEDPYARPDPPEERLDDIDDEAAVAGIFDGEIRAERRRAAAAVAGARARRARGDGRPSAGGAGEESQASSNATSPPTTVTTALPGTS